jgi:hypothetical protein
LIYLLEKYTENPTWKGFSKNKLRMLGAEDVDGRLELQERFEHLRRVAMKESAPRMRLYDQLHKFPNIYKEFLSKYTRQQLEGLEKCFLG